MRELAAAFAFLTRMPVARNSVFDAKTVARAARWFPLVGAVLGGIYAGSLRLLAPVFPPLVAAAIVTSLDAAVTGAMHLDGLADTADGFGAGRRPEDVLRIMRDHAIGTYGAVALLLAIVLKVGAISALVGSGRGVVAVFLAPVLGRWTSVLLGATRSYARPPEHDGPYSVGSPTRFMGRTELAIATVTAITAAVAFGWPGGAAAALAGAVAAFWGWRCQRRIGGVTGDTLGAGIEIAECAVLLLFTVWR